jgi:hypothetical protein
MSENNSPRPVLKLKAALRNTPREVKIPPPTQPSKVNQKPGAAWSDEFKRRMQEDMDALVTR